VQTAQPRPVNTYFFQTMIKKDTNGAVTRTDNFGWAPIHYAAFHNKLAIINIILKNNLDPNQTTLAMRVPNTISARPLHERTRTPLHLASMEGNWSIALSLLKAGADCKRLDEDGFMPIVYAMLARQELQSRLKKKKSAHDEHPGLIKQITKEGQLPVGSEAAEVDAQERVIFFTDQKGKHTSTAEQEEKVKIDDRREEKKPMLTGGTSNGQSSAVELVVMGKEGKPQALEIDMYIPSAEQLKQSMKERQKGIETYTITINALLNYGSSIAEAVDASNKPINELIDIEATWDDFSSRIQANQLLIRKIEDECYTKMIHETSQVKLTALREEMEQKNCHP